MSLKHKISTFFKNCRRIEKFVEYNLYQRKGVDILIIKERSRPLIIDGLEALIARLHVTHPKIPQLESSLYNYKKGYRGEKSIDYFLNLLPEKDFHIFHGLRLPLGKSFFQMDTLIVSPYFILILEVKHISGTLTFQVESNQMIRTYNDVEEGMANPILQARRHEYQLKRFLQSYNFPKVPIESFVIISDAKTIIKSTNQSVYKKVKQGANLPFLIENMGLRYPNQCLSLKDIKKMTRQLMKSHTVHIPDVLKKYSIDESEIITGVCCLNCGSLPMERFRGFWLCRQCGVKSKTAHIPSIREFALLYGSNITNKRLRDFLHISSDSVAKRILTSSNLDFKGKTKDRVYIIPLKEEM